MADSIAKPKPQMGSYNGAEASPRRKNPSTRPKSVDGELFGSRKRHAIENARDLDKNFAIASWAIRRHLDYVSTFNFEPKTGDKGLDADLRMLMEGYTKPERCHVAHRHSLFDMVRLAEAARTVDGDVLLVKLSSGHMQAIEADRIQDPPSQNRAEGARWTNGVQTTKSGKAQAYGVHERNDNRGYLWERAVRASNAFHHGYFQRFDQVRGVSPLMAALDPYRDLHEGLGLALAKAKVTQMFGLLIHTAGDSVGDHSDAGDGKFDVDFGQGPFKLELDADAGEDAKFIESASPPMELQSFAQTMIAICLKSLDIPFSFYDESFTNFFGSRAAFIHYQRSSKSKIRQNQDLQNKITNWRLNGFVLSGDLVLPSGMLVKDLGYEWVPTGTAWWNPAQEVAAHEKALTLGLTTRQKIVKETHGLDWETDVLPQLQRENELMGGQSE